jgi:hypothetical protein
MKEVIAMRNRTWWYVGAMIVIALLVGAWTTRGQASPKVLWEYKCVFALNVPNKPEMEKPSLNDLGAEGWELVAVDRETVTEAVLARQPTTSNVPDSRDCSFHTISNATCVHIVGNVLQSRPAAALDQLESCSNPENTVGLSRRKSAATRE